MDIEQIRAMRRGCTRIGIAMLAFLVAANGSAAILSIIYQLLCGLGMALPSLGGSAEMILSDLSIYGIGGLVLWLVLGPLPVSDSPNNRGVTPKRFGKLTLEALGLMEGFALLTSAIVSLLYSLVGHTGSDILQNTVDDLSVWEILLFMVVIAPVCEELLFRRILLRRLLPMGQGFAILVGGLCFGLFHCNLYQFFYAFAVGILFSSVAVKTGRLRYTIALHMVMNLLGSAVITLVQDNTVLYNTYAVLIYIAAAAGIWLVIRDRRNLMPAGGNLPGCWRAFLTAPGMLAFLIITGIYSIIVPFLT